MSLQRIVATVPYRFVRVLSEMALRQPWQNEKRLLTPFDVLDRFKSTCVVRLKSGLISSFRHPLHLAGVR